ncbi:MAG: SDR family oxidoreductase [Candidatus Dormibacteraeota bacterium]|uniref:SDR family oxidoreductase n=1 Tax=Candidatus Amunia macphersoniae TaxID=3127014 RepID=A0A934NE82_9BACT|nr:SDR family oxidoreductase [Candidatus Dormibacteraeota bacterium]
MTELAGSGALVTGGAGAIGVAVARRLLALGAEVTLADVDADGGPETAARLGCHFVRTDVRRADDLTAAVQAAGARGPLRFVHLNAGIVLERSYDETDESSYRRIVGVNLDGVFWGIRAAVPALRSGGGGAIVASASLAGLVPVPLDPLYAMTKSAVISLVRSIGPGLGAEGIRLNCVCPGFVDTPMAPAVVREMGFPLLRVDDVADAVMAIAAGDDNSQAYVIQPGLEPFAYRFRGVPGARTHGDGGERTVSATGIVGSAAPTG